MRNDHQAIGRTSVSAGSRRFATSATEDIHVRTTIAGVAAAFLTRKRRAHGDHLKRTQCLGIFLGGSEKKDGANNLFFLRVRLCREILLNL